jgi:hypothetical protein
MSHMVIFKTADQGIRFAVPRNFITEVWGTDDDNVCMLEYRRFTNGKWITAQERVVGSFYSTIAKLEEAV